ncbi:hypothetical protein CWI84_01510 [Idiomarina tyrosinivorans]|uniref:Outer membrane protein assembly factor BamC n=1 Tax=Idiomarina tyrosinivorans TaxID=1445662 RepID=A0A432ZUA1_9GAMM|nr:outer membrane protein assembly factor BamC [Idiomarina tyrosinivorans]RUO81463.1 hypothetical protein CWI84_01510 [Idiomarina tyrosinivorans]
MKLSKVAVIVALSAIVGACSSTDLQQVQGKADYVTEQQLPDLKIAKGLAAPNTRDDYNIPKPSNNNAPIGDDVNVMAPVQVRPLALGSQTSETDGAVDASFDLVDGMGDSIAGFVWGATETVLDRLDIAVDEQQMLKQIRTGRATYISRIADDNQPYFTFVKDASSFPNSSTMNFVIQFDTAAHGRSTEIVISAENFQHHGPQAVADEYVKHNAAATLLNDIISEVNREHQLNLKTRLKNGLDVERGFNADGEPAYIIDSDFDSAWSVLEPALNQSGFVVSDLNRETGVYYTDYAEPDSGFLSFGSDDYADYGIAEGEYEFRMIEQGTRVSVTVWYNDKVVDSAWINKVFQGLSTAIKAQSKM